MRSAIGGYDKPKLGSRSYLLYSTRGRVNESMRRMRGVATAVAVTFALSLPGATTATADKSSTPPIAHVAHSCSSGYKHAVTPGGHKCLRVGQHCSTKPGYASVYKSKGFVCRNGRLKHRVRIGAVKVGATRPRLDSNQRPAD